MSEPDPHPKPRAHPLMKPARFPRCLILAGLIAAGVRADQADDVIVAAMKLSASPNYSWDTTIEEGPRTTAISGQTNESGFSLITFNRSGTSGSSPAGGRAGSGGDTNTVFLGDSKYVVQTDSGWSSPGSQPADSSSSPSSSSSGNRGGGTGNGGTYGSRGGGNSGLNLGGVNLGGGGRRGGGGGGSRSSRGKNASEDSSTSTPARLPSGINLPHEELAIIVANYTDLHFDPEVVGGTLTESGADLLLLPPNSTDTPPAGAAGTFRLWIKDGAVTKYEVHLSAKTAPGGRTVKGGFSETITVELKEVGTTKFVVPAAAKQKLTG